MSRDAPNINHFWAQLIVEELVRNGVHLFCLAPGSRSTPLITAVARHPDAEYVIHVDERGTAFYAAGYARATRQPAAWITTSGTAVANGLPAVVEAASDHLPLILLTADRPPELRATGANQTIDQVKIFGDYVEEFFDLPPPDPELDPAMVLTTIDQLVHRTRSAPSGPVHLNCMFRKPLAPEPDPFDLPPAKSRMQRWRRNDRPFTIHEPAVTTPPSPTVERIARHLEDADRGLIIAGRLAAIEQGHAVQKLAETLQWPLLPDICSEIRLDSGASTSVPYYNQLLAIPAFADEHTPDTVLRFGARSTSKRLRQFITAAAPEHHIVVKNYPERFDIDHDVSKSIETEIASFAERLNESVEPAGSTDWLQSWRSASDTVERTLDAYAADSAELREPRIARLLSVEIPSDHGLFLASSRPVRDVDAFGRSRDAAVPVAANRGASGIDGTIASAAGFARGLSTPVTLMIGDLAVLHDLNALAIVRDSAQPVITVAINNDGGGIFSFLPIADHEDVFEEFFGTPFDVSLEPAAEMFDLPYARPNTSNAFVTTYREMIDAGRSGIIEIQTDRAVNREEHKRIEQLVHRAISDA